MLSIVTGNASTLCSHNTWNQNPWKHGKWDCLSTLRLFAAQRMSACSGRATSWTKCIMPSWLEQMQCWSSMTMQVTCQQQLHQRMRAPKSRWIMLVYDWQPQTRQTSEAAEVMNFYQPCPACAG